MISYTLKRKRDAEERLRRRPKYYGEAPSEGVVTTVDDYTTEGTGLPPAEEPPPSTNDGSTDTGSSDSSSILTKFAKEYSGILWEVKHNLGSDPVVSIWVHGVGTIAFGLQEFGTSSFGGSSHGFGIREFGTSYFGGKPGSYTQLSNEATIKKIDNNTFRVEWPITTQGKVVAIA